MPVITVGKSTSVLARLVYVHHYDRNSAGRPKLCVRDLHFHACSLPLSSCFNERACCRRGCANGLLGLFVSYSGETETFLVHVRTTNAKIWVVFESESKAIAFDFVEDYAEKLRQRSIARRS